MSDEYKFDFSTGDNIQFSDQDGTSELETVLSNFGLSPQDVFEMDMSGPEEEFVLEGDDGLSVELLATEEAKLDKSIRLSANIDMVDTLFSFANCTSELLTVLTPRVAQEDSVAVKYAMNRSEFAYMPDDVFRVFHSILVDLAVKDEFQKYSTEDCLDISLDKLNKDVRWTPNLNNSEYANSFGKWHRRFRKLAGTSSQVGDSDLSALVNMDELHNAHNVFILNTRPFVVVTNFLADDKAKQSDTAVHKDLYGELCHSYQAEQRKSTLLVSDLYEVFMSYIGSDDLTRALHLTRDEALNYSTGELLRRYLLFELENGMFYPVSLIHASRGREMDVLGDVIYKAMVDGSVAAELLVMLRTMMLLAKGAKKMIADQFMQDIFSFLVTYINDSAVVNPVFYGNAVHRDGRFYLDYVDGENINTIESDTVLCNIIGTKYNLYCYPKVLFDDKTGHAICPAPQLLNSLRALAKGGRPRISGGMVFELNPTIGWLISNHVLAEDKDSKEEKESRGITGEANGLLQTLLSYDNKFVTEAPEVNPLILVQEDKLCKVFAVPKGPGDEGFIVAGIDSTDASVGPIAKGGLLVYADSNIITQYVDLKGSTEDVVFDTQYSKQERIADSMDKQSNGAVSLQDVMFPVEPGVTEIEYVKYQSAVMQLCEMAMLDYQEELAFVQQIISRDLLYLVNVPGLDGLLATNILKSYKKLCDERGELDRVNFQSLQELVDLLVGKPNDFEGVKEYKPEFASKLQNCIEKQGRTLVQLCQYLDALDLDVLAMQVLSVNQISRMVDSDIYKAYRQLPGVGSRVRLLENKMIVLHIFSILKDHSITVFNKFTPLARVYNEEITAKTVDVMHEILKEKMRKKYDVGNVFSLPLVRDIVNQQVSPDTVMLKYFALERDAYSFISAMQSHGEKYSKLSQQCLVSLGLSPTVQLTKVSQAAFNKQVTREDVERMFSQNIEDLHPIIRCGFISEAVSNGMFQVARAYDLFNSYYPILVGKASEKLEMGDRDSLLDYTASFVVSYSPVLGEAANAVDGGTDRASAFATASDDFYSTFDLDCIRPYKLEDLRVIVGGGE